MAGDARQLAAEVDALAVLGEALRERAGAADLELFDPREVPVQFVERGEGLHQGGGGAVADARDAGNVVDLVTGERQIVGKALRGDAEVALDVVVAELVAEAVIPEQVAVTHELREVLVARDE